MDSDFLDSWPKKKQTQFAVNTLNEFIKSRGISDKDLFIIWNDGRHREGDQKTVSRDYVAINIKLEDDQKNLSEYIRIYNALMRAMPAFIKKCTVSLAIIPMIPGIQGQYMFQISVPADDSIIEEIIANASDISTVLSTKNMSGIKSAESWIWPEANSQKINTNNSGFENDSQEIDAEEENSYTVSTNSIEDRDSYLDSETGKAHANMFAHQFNKIWMDDKYTNDKDRVLALLKDYSKYDCDVASFFVKATRNHVNDIKMIISNNVSSNKTQNDLINDLKLLVQDKLKNNAGTISHLLDFIENREKYKECHHDFSTNLIRALI